MKKEMKLLWKSVKMDLQHHLAYRVHFFFNMLNVFITGILVPFAVMVIYQISNGIPGWTYQEFLFFYGTNYLIWGIASMFFETMIYRVEWRVRNGYLDIWLLRPLKTEVLFAITSQDTDSISMIIMGLFLIFFSAPQISFTLLSLLIYVGLCFCGIVVLYSIALMITGAAIKFVQISPLLSFYWVMGDFTDYPLSIFNREIRMFLTYIFPLGIISFYPSSFFLGKTTNYFMLVGLVVTTIVFFFLAKFLFKKGLESYTSAGG